MIKRRTFLSYAMAARELRLATFSADVTPLLGSPLCYGLVPPAGQIVTPLEARGIVLLPPGEAPVVLCAVDWLGIGNTSRDRWRSALAQAAGTTPDRVALHTVHQHDAPGDDDAALALLPKGIPLCDGVFAREATRRTAVAIRAARPERITRITAGAAAVEQVASNRRILGPDGKVVFGRMTACRNSPHCGDPEGVIDPTLRSVGFWNGAKRKATLCYYATHPMSYYGRGGVSADFVGMARNRPENGFTVYFTGAAGNIGAGRYNDGAPEMRAVLADRMASAMAEARAAESTVEIDHLRWKTVPVALPPREGPGFSEAEIEAVISDSGKKPTDRANHARYLAYLRLSRAGRQIQLSTLRIGSLDLLHMPGELFVEYQLAAARMRPASIVAMAAYGDYGPMYIGTARAYGEGGYETSAVSRVGPGSEEILLDALHRLLG